MDRGMKLKARQKNLGLKDREVEKASGLSIDTIRKLGRINMTDALLDELESAIEAARMSRIKSLQAG